MSTPPGSADRDSNIRSIYEMLADIQGTQRRHGNRLEEIDDHVGDIDGHLESVESRLGDIDGELDRILGLLDR